MPTYTIYHLTGIKVGCTTNLTRRIVEYRTQGHLASNIQILEVLDDVTEQEAGDREWWWADHFGYPRGNHFTQVRLEARIANGRKGGLTRAAKLGPEALAEQGRRLAQNTNALLTPEKRAEMGRRGAQTREERFPGAQSAIGRRVGQLTAEQGIGIHDPSRRKEWASRGGKAVAEHRSGDFYATTTCPHCGTTGQGAVMKRWHFASCKQALP